MADKNYSFKKLSPYGFEVIEIDLDKMTDEFTNIVPNYSLQKPIFNTLTNVWEEYDETADLKKLAMQQAADITSLKQLAMQKATELAELKKGSAE